MIAAVIEWTVVGEYLVPGQPRPKARPVFDQRSGRMVTPGHTRAETDRVAAYLRIAGPRKPFEGDLAVILRFRRSDRRKVDVDNLTKLALDAANGILWIDDAQIFRIDAEKILGVSEIEASTYFQVRRRTPESEGKLL